MQLIGWWGCRAVKCEGLDIYSEKGWLYIQWEWSPWINDESKNIIIINKNNWSGQSSNINIVMLIMKTKLKKTW